MKYTMGIIISCLVSVTIAGIIFWNEGYKKGYKTGQIDYAMGRIEYVLVTNPTDGTTNWGKYPGERK